MMGDLGKLIAAKGFQKLPKVHKIARSGNTGNNQIQDAAFMRYLGHASKVQNAIIGNDI